MFDFLRSGIIEQLYFHALSATISMTLSISLLERERGEVRVLLSQKSSLPSLAHLERLNERTYPHNHLLVIRTLPLFQHSLILSSTSQSKKTTLSQISLDSSHREEKRERYVPLLQILLEVEHKVSVLLDLGIVCV